MVQKLADIAAIQQIKSLYCDLIDRIRREGNPADVDRLASLFTEDAVLDFSQVANVDMGVLRGRAAIVRHFGQDLPAAIAWMWHAVHTPIIEIDGDEALGRWTLYAMAVPVTDPSSPPSVTYGRYTDRFRRIDGTWYQSSLKFLNETR